MSRQAYPHRAPVESFRPASRAAAPVLGAALSACVADFEEPISPDEPALVAEISIDDGAIDVPVDAVILIRLNQYLDADASDVDRAVRLTAGVLRAFGRVEYNPVAREIRLAPFEPLRPGMGYEVEVRADRLRSVLGTALAEDVVVGFTTAASPAAGAPAAEPAPDWGDVLAIFERCACHRAEGSQLVALDHDSLVNRRSASLADRFLVAPFEPEQSYLLEKLLPDYPDRIGSAMPPPWSGEAPLDAGALRVVEAWIRDGARGP